MGNVFPILFFLMGCFLFSTCKKENAADSFAQLNLPATPFNYAEIDLPEHFINNYFPDDFLFQFAAIESDNTPPNNQITNHGATLGRVLFYEKKLSANGTIACASCHQQELGFSDDRTSSEGFAGGLTRRHAMSLTNSRFYDSGRFFWDERAETLEDQVLIPFLDSLEMGLTISQLVQIVEEQPYASTLFKNAFGSETVTAERIALALAQFIRSMVSTNSKYDQGRILVNSPLEGFPNFSTEENVGKQLFFAQNLVAPSCHTCHKSEAFVAPLLASNAAAATSATNNGLDSTSTNDFGVFESSGVVAHIGKFKVPSLRNVALRAPYMHDGRFANLEEVIEHYSSGIQNHPNLEPFLKNANDQPIRYNFSENQKKALIAFLKTLTDEIFIGDEKFSNPFLN